MGGAVYAPGNITAIIPNSGNKVAEWNIYADPQAAKEVFESGLKMYLIPLDATNLVTINKKDTAQIRKGGRIGNFVADIYDSWIISSGRPNMYIWDLMASMIMIKPELCGLQGTSSGSYHCKGQYLWTDRGHSRENPQYRCMSESECCFDQTDHDR